MTLLIALLGAGIGVGILLVIDAFRTPVSPRSATNSALRSRLPVDARQRGIQAVVAALILGLVTRWPVAFLGGAALGWFVTDFVGGTAARQRDIARTEAIASWTEMLRDTISGAHGLEETIITSAHVAPDAIREEVVRLGASLQRQPLELCLRRFAHDLSHPTGDLVVAALSLAAGGSVRELGDLLGTLAVAARDEAGMHLRIEAARARMRTAVRVIAACTVLTAVALALLNRSYLSSYSDGAGQGMLALIAGVWGASLWWLTRMSRFASPERFFATKEVSA